MSLSLETDLKPKLPFHQLWGPTPHTHPGLNKHGIVQPNHQILIFG